MLISGAFPTDFAHSACVFRTVDSDSRRSPARRRMQRKNVMPKSKIRLRGSVFGLRFAKAFRGSPGGGRYCVSVIPTDESDRRSASARGIGRRMLCARSLSGYRGVRRNGYSLHVGTEMRRCAPRAYLMQSRDISAPVGKDRGQSEHIGTFLIGIRRGLHISERICLRPCAGLRILTGLHGIGCEFCVCGRRKARLAEHFEVQSNVRILYTRYLCRFVAPKTKFF